MKLQYGFHFHPHAKFRYLSVISNSRLVSLRESRIIRFPPTASNLVKYSSMRKADKFRLDGAFSLSKCCHISNKWNYTTDFDAHLPRWQKNRQACIPHILIYHLLLHFWDSPNILPSTIQKRHFTRPSFYLDPYYPCGIHCPFIFHRNRNNYFLIMFMIWKKKKTHFMFVFN